MPITVMLTLALFQTATEPEALARVSFESPHDLIVLTVDVRGTPLRLLLDSGASHTIVDAEVARRIGLKSGQSSTRRSTSANSSATMARLPGGLSITLRDGFELKLKRVMAGPIEETVRVMMGLEAQGILGNEFFEQYTVEVDYAARTLSLFDSVRYMYEGEGAELPLTFPSNVSRLPFARATYENGGHTVDEVRILVDSGGMTMGTASISRPSDWNSLLVSGDRVISMRGATGLSDDPEGTTHSLHTTQIDRFQLGPFAFEDALISHSTEGPGFGIFGATILHRFTVVFDYARNRLILEPNPRLTDPFFGDWSGATLVAAADDAVAIHVMHVIENMPAARAGLRRGDEVLSINGVDADQISIEQVRRMMSSQAKFALAVRRGKETFEVVFETTSPW